MNIKIFEYIAQAIKNITSLCNKLVDAGDAEKYAQGVQSLNESVDETYAKMREVILNDNTLTSDQKLERLEKIANSQVSARQTCEEAIKGNRENISKIVGDVLLVAATCGLSKYIPAVRNGKAKKVKELPKGEAEQKYIEEQQ